jgi:hypothetical protein
MLRNFKSAFEIAEANTISSREIVDQLIRRYATFKSYTCRASLFRQIQGHVVIRSHFDMRFTFVRPGKLCLVWWSCQEKEKGGVLLASAGTVIDYSNSKMKWRSGKSIESGIARHSGVSAGLCMHIPCLLISSKQYKLF